MTTQNYLMINKSTNIVDNETVWDGNTETWQPPSEYLMLVQSTTPAMLWDAVIEDGKWVDWALGEHIGEGGIGFTWDGSVLTTNEPKPEPPKPNPPIPTQS